MATRLATLAVLLAGARPTPDDDGSGWKMLQLDLVVTVLPEEERLAVEGTARLRLEGVATSLGPTLTVNRGAAVMSFAEVRADGAEVRFPLRTDATRRASLRFPEPFVRGAELEVTFLLESSGRAEQLAVLQDIAYGSWVTGWYPVPLPVTLDGTTSLQLGAPGTTRFELPSGWSAVSNGRLVSEEPVAHGTSALWRIDEPVARSFAAGPYQTAVFRAGERDFRVYLLAPKPGGAATQAETLSRAIRAMEARFGPYPYSGFAIAEVPNDTARWFASSEQGFILAMSAVFEEEGGNLPLFSHEAAHAWWGNLVSERGAGGMLCSESLAQYGAVIAIEELSGAASATEFMRFGKGKYVSDHGARGYFEILREGKDVPLAQLTGGFVHRSLAEAKGHWVYHMLRHQVGDELFFATLRGLLHDFSGRPMSLNDVREAFVRAAPAEAQIERFFADWLDRPGAPVLDVEWRPILHEAVHEVELVVRQEGTPYRLPLEVRVDSPSGERLTTVVVDGAECTVRIPAKGPPSGVAIDPQHRLLLWDEELGPRPTR